MSSYLFTLALTWVADKLYMYVPIFNIYENTLLNLLNIFCELAKKHNTMTFSFSIHLCLIY